MANGNHENDSGDQTKSGGIIIGLSEDEQGQMGISFLSGQKR